MLGKFGQSLVTGTSGPNVPWWCGAAITQIFPAQWTPSCYPASQLPVVAPPAPQTREQMTQPGAWTPDQAAQILSQQQKGATAEYFKSIPPVTGYDLTGGGNGNGGPAPGDLCSKIFGSDVAGLLGRVLCPVVMVVGGVAVIALVGLVFTARR
jgi:hypothetical protein